jgi:hypothetical protein
MRSESSELHNDCDHPWMYFMNSFIREKTLALLTLCLGYGLALTTGGILTAGGDKLLLWWWWLLLHLPTRD